MNTKWHVYKQQLRMWCAKSPVTGITYAFDTWAEAFNLAIHNGTGLHFTHHG